jgi:hypothetical protein
MLWHADVCSKAYVSIRQHTSACRICCTVCQSTDLAFVHAMTCFSSVLHTQQCQNVCIFIYDIAHTQTNTRTHTHKYTYIPERKEEKEEVYEHCHHLKERIRQHTSAYVSIRQHASACVSIRQHTSACVSMRQHASE